MLPDGALVSPSARVAVHGLSGFLIMIRDTAERGFAVITCHIQEWNLSVEAHESLQGSPESATDVAILPSPDPRRKVIVLKAMD